MDFEKVEAYESKDGNLYKTKEQAEHQNKRVDFKAWYEDEYVANFLDDAEGHSVEADHLMDWLEDNRESVIDFLKEDNDTKKECLCNGNCEDDDFKDKIGIEVIKLFTKEFANGTPAGIDKQNLDSVFGYKCDHMDIFWE